MTIDPSLGIIRQPGPSMLRSIRAGRQPSEADVDADVRAEFGRLSQPSLFPSLYVRPNETGRFIPLSDALAAVKGAFSGPRPPTADELCSLLAHKIRVIGIPGSPDLFGAVCGILFWVELKKPAWRSPSGRLYPGGTLNDDQKKWHATAKRRSVPVAIIDGPEQVEPFVRSVAALRRPGA